MRIISWNVNGIRAVQKKGFVEWVLQEQPDILCLQETKAWPEQLDNHLMNIDGYSSYWNTAQRKGYSGVATYSQKDPHEVKTQFKNEYLDGEGRLLLTRYTNFTLLNVYFPNGQMNEERLAYKIEFYKAIMNYCRELRKVEKNLIICGDFNTAHHEIDLARPQANENISGFLPVERQLLDTFLNEGYIDVYRHFNPDKVSYTWWSYRTRARERDVGWRIDYFYVSTEMIDFIQDCYPLSGVQGSDHCPIMLVLKAEIDG